MNLIDFRKRMATDATFAAGFAGCKTVDELVRAAADKGYIFTAEEMTTSTDVLPEELEMAAGGMGYQGTYALNWFNSHGPGNSLGS